MPPKYRWHRNEVMHDFFANVTTPLQAYLLGFLAAGGNVLSPQNRIGVELSTKDVDLLMLIRGTLAPSHQIRKRTRSASDKRYGSGEYCTLSFTSARMAQDLARYGIVPAKTLHLRWPSLSCPLNWRGTFYLATLMATAISRTQSTLVFAMASGE
jgi:hypothetical protein